MSSGFGQCNGTLILLVAILTGCRMGSPLDRNVQISQQFGDEGVSDPPPRTRLAAPSTPLASSSPAGDAARQWLSDGERSADSAPGQPRVAAQKQAAEATARRSTATRSLATVNDAAESQDTEVDFAELIAAFGDSPPEVQQQAIRQLMAASNHRASKTDQPQDISEQLQRSLSALPILSDDAEEPDSFPTRLAATSPAAAARGTATDPEASDPRPEAGDSRPEPSDTSSVAQAVVQSAAAQPEVAPASATLSNPIEDATSLQESQALASSPPPAADEQLTANKLPAAADAALYDELISRLRSPQAGESDADRFRREIIKRYLQVLAGDPDSAVESLQGLTAAEQEFLRHHLLALWNITDADGHPVTSRRFATALPQFRLATQHLSEATEQLDIRSLAWCTEILSYGQVKRFTSDRFEAGQKVILYCEVDNFVAEKLADGYQTELQGSYEIFDDKGSKVAGQVLPVDRQLCDHYLRDYFIAYQMHLPTQLEPGDYRLELSMQCAKGRKYGQGTLPLVIKK